MSRELFRELNRNKSLQKALESKAEEIASRARAITRAEGGQAQITTEFGIRPGGRARVNVVSSDAEEEFGREGKKRTRAIGRAARGG